MQVGKKNLRKDLMKLMEKYEIEIDDVDAVSELLKEVVEERDEKVRTALNIRGDAEFKKFVRQIDKTDNSFYWYELQKKFNIGSVSGLRNLRGCFKGTGFEYINLNGLSMNGAENLVELFRDCENLTEVVMDEVDLSSVKDMSAMFYDCLNLEKVYIYDSDMPNVESMSWMFYNCEKLRVAYLNNLKVPSLRTTECMFRNCFSLESPDFYGTTFEGHNVNMHSMFEGCRSLDRMDMSKLNFGEESNLSSLFKGCINLKSVDFRDSVISESTVLDEMFIPEDIGCNKKIEISSKSKYLIECLKHIKELDFIDGSWSYREDEETKYKITKLFDRVSKEDSDKNNSFKTTGMF